MVKYQAPGSALWRLLVPKNAPFDNFVRAPTLAVHRRRYVPLSINGIHKEKQHGAGEEEATEEEPATHRSGP
jgi:DNA-binding NarL/FixJ family response regulator